MASTRVRRRTSRHHFARVEAAVERFSPRIWAITQRLLRRWLSAQLSAMRQQLEARVRPQAFIDELAQLEQLQMAMKPIIAQMSNALSVEFGLLATDPRRETLHEYVEWMLRDDLSRYWQTLTDPGTLARRLTAHRDRGLSYLEASRAVAAQYQTEFYRAERLVRSSYNAGANYANYLDLLNNYEYVEWVTARDSRVRRPKRASPYDHAGADGQIRRIGEPFIVSGERMMFPGDRSLGASPGNVINCRCTLVGIERGPVTAAPIGRPPRPRDGAHAASLLSSIEQQRQVGAEAIRAEINDVAARRLAAIRQSMAARTPLMGEVHARVYEELRVRQNILVSEMKLLMADHQRAVRAVLELPASQRSQITVTMIGDAPADVRRIVREGQQQFERLVHRDVVGAFATATIRYDPRVTRAYYDLRTKEIVIGRNVTFETMVHELGHWLEDRNAAVMNRAVAFYERRTAGQPLRTMNEMTGLTSYSSNEVGREGGFFRHYVGREYRDNRGNIYATEISSTALETMQPDTIAQLMQDVEHFEVVYNAIRNVRD